MFKQSNSCALVKASYLEADIGNRMKLFSIINIPIGFSITSWQEENQCKFALNIREFKYVVSCDSRESFYITLLMIASTTDIFQMFQHINLNYNQFSTLINCSLFIKICHRVFKLMQYYNLFPCLLLFCNDLFLQTSVFLTKTVVL